MVMYGICIGESSYSRVQFFNIQPVETQVGLFMEEVTSLKFYHDEWKIVTHINITTYNAEFKNLKLMAEKVSEFCGFIYKNLANVSLDITYDSSHGCKTISEQLQEVMIDLEEVDSHYWLDTPNQNRTRRSVAPFIGDIANILFGTLSERHGEGYIKEFQRLNQNGLSRDSILHKQTSLLKSVIGTMESDRERVKGQWLKFDMQIAQIKNQLNYINVQHLSEKRINNLNMGIQTLTSYVTLLIIGFKHKQKQFLDIVSVGHKSSNNPTLLPPKMFMEELKRIKQIISAEDLELPLELTQHNLASFYKLSVPETIILDNQLIISITVPLVNRKQFSLFKPASIPYNVGNSLFGFISPTHDFIAIDPVFEKYVYISNDELSACYHVNNNYLVCKASNPIMNADSSNICEIELLRLSNITRLCNIRIANLTQELWIKLHKPNSWVFVFPIPTQIFITCGNVVKTQIVNQVGTIEINPMCQIKTDNVMIYGHRVRENNIAQSEIPFRKADALLKEITKFINATDFQIPVIDEPKVIEFGQNDKLEDLSISLEDLQAFQKKHQAVLAQQKVELYIKRVSFSSIAGVFITILLIICVFKNWSCISGLFFCNNILKNRTNIKPQVPPRQPRKSVEDFEESTV